MLVIELKSLVAVDELFEPSFVLWLKKAETLLLREGKCLSVAVDDKEKLLRLLLSGEADFESEAFDAFRRLDNSSILLNKSDENFKIKLSF